jgi:hypothetical protein
MLLVKFDRINGSTALTSLRSEKVSIRGEKAMIELRLSAEHEIELHFPAPGGVIDHAWMELARTVLAQIAGMDNTVQQYCSEACKREGHHPRNYEGELAYITLTAPEAAVLHYFGTGVNTEWEVRFVRESDLWCRA